MDSVGKVRQEFYFSPSLRVEDSKNPRDSRRLEESSISDPPDISLISRRSSGRHNVAANKIQGNIEARAQSSAGPSSFSGKKNDRHPENSHPAASGAAGGKSMHRAPNRGRSSSNNTKTEGMVSVPHLREISLSRPSNHSTRHPSQKAISTQMRSQSLNLTPSYLGGSGDTVEILINDKHRKNAQRQNSTKRCENKGTTIAMKKNEKQLSVEKLTRDSTNELSVSSRQNSYKSKSDVLSARERGSVRYSDSSLSACVLPSIDSAIPPPRMPQTSTLEATHPQRAKSERAGEFQTRSGSGCRAVCQPRELGRSSARRAEGMSILPSIFCRGRLMSWPTGVAPQVVYAAETSHDLDDGHGAAGLSATLLCKMGAKHRAWDIVRVGQKFCMRVVGWHGGDIGNKVGKQSGRTVVYSVRHREDGGTKEGFAVHGGPAQVHDERNSGDFKGYHYVSERLGTAATWQSAGMEQVGLTVGVWVGGGEADEGKVVDVQGEVRWRVLAEGDGECAGRIGASLLRYGYYFFLDAPCATRLFTNTDTPEHIRLMARRQVDGAVDMEASKLLTYVVVRVTAD